MNANETTPTVTPYTHDTYPKGNTWVRLKDSSTNDDRLVTAVFSQGVIFTDGGATYDKLAENCEISVDGRVTWQPAGVVA